MTDGNFENLELLCFDDYGKSLILSSTLKEVDYSILTITSPTKKLLEIKKDGTIIAPDLESASEAGRVFVESMRESLLKLLGENKNG